MKKIFVKGLVSALLLIAYTESSATSSSVDAVKWLGRMADALRQENYEGIFTYIRARLLKQ